MQKACAGSFGIITKVYAHGHGMIGLYLEAALIT